MRYFKKLFLLFPVLFFLLVSCGESHTHNYVMNSNDVKHWKECSCGEKIEEENHIFGEWQIIEAATSNSTGTRQRLCSICQYKETEEIKPKEPEETKGLEYSLNGDNNSYTVVGIGSATNVIDLVIPSSYQNLPVEKISVDCFANQRKLKSVTLSKNMKFIDTRGFSECRNIEKVYYLGTLEDWCKITFKSSTSTPLCYGGSFYLRNQSGAFEKITTLNIPNTITEIKKATFEGFQDVTDIVIPEGIKAVREVAFSGCIKISNIELPKTLIIFEDDAFFMDEEVSNITKTIKYNGTIADWCHVALANIYASPMQNKFVFYMLDENGNSIQPSQNLEIPDSVTSIGDCCFFNWSILKEIILPDSIIKIGNSAFEDCVNLEKIYYKGTKYLWNNIEIPYDPNIDSNTLYFYSENEPDESGNFWHYENGDISIWNKTQGHTHNFSDDWTIDKAATCTEEGSKSHHCTGCDEKTDITSIPATGHSFGEWTIVQEPTEAITGTKERECNICHYKENDTIPIIQATSGLLYEWNKDTESYSVIGIEDTTVTNIKIPSIYNNCLVTSIGASAFSKCSNLESIIIPKSIKCIGLSALNYCINLRDVYYDGSLEDYCRVILEDWIFDYSGTEKNHFYIKNKSNVWEEVIDLVIPETLTTIGKYQFACMKNINSVILPNSVTKILEGAFFMDFRISKITLSNCLTTIESFAFYSCCSFKSITLPSSVTSIKEGAFTGCYIIEIFNLSNLNIEKATIENGQIGMFAMSIHSQIEPSSLFQQGDYEYYCDENQEYYLASYKGNEKDVVLPSNINGKTYQLGGCVFACADITSITIPSSVTGIVYGDFVGCDSLDNVYYEGTIEDWNNIDFIGDNVNSNPMSYASHFYLRNSNNEWEEVTSIEIPNTVTEIGKYQFYGFNNVTSITIPDSVTSIGENAFSNCSSLTSITIPDNVTDIGYSAFSNCSSLTSITIPFVGNTNFVHIFGYHVPDSLNQVIITGGESIGEYAFSDCSSLTSITIPTSVRSIGKDAFGGCIRLVEVYNLSSLQITKGSSENGKIGCYAKVIHTSLEEESNLITKDDFVFYKDNENKYYLIKYTGTESELVLPSDIEGSNYAINNYAFKACFNLTSVTIPSNVLNIGRYAFCACINLTSVTLPNNVISVSSSAFIDCSKLVYNEYNNGLYLGNNENPYIVLVRAKNQDIINFEVNRNTKFIACSFVDCYSLNSITIYDNVVGIDSYFSALSAIYYEGVLEDWCKIKLSGRLFSFSKKFPHFYLRNSNNEWEEVTTIEIPNTITEIGRWQFYGFGNVASITIPNSVTSIGTSSFEDCSSLTSITIPNSVVSIGEYAFSDCSSLTSIVIGNSVTSIGNRAFSGCSKLKEVFYFGTSREWESVQNSSIISATCFYYSEIQPIEVGNYWHYVEGVPTKWN